MHLFWVWKYELSIHLYHVFLSLSLLISQVIHFGLLPSSRVNQALRALAYQIALGNIAHDLTSKELLALLESGKGSEGGGHSSSGGGGCTTTSGLDYWAYEQPKHELIT